MEKTHGAELENKPASIDLSLPKVTSRERLATDYNTRKDSSDCHANSSKPNT